MQPEGLAQAVCMRYQSMDRLRAEHIEVWRRCMQYSFPLLQHGFFGEIVTAQNGLAELSRLNDSTTTEAVRSWSSLMISGLTPSNSIWFDMSMVGANEAEKRFLSSSARAIWENIHNSNFDAVTFEAMLYAATAGWFVLFIDEAKEGGYHFELWPIPECYIASSRAGAAVDTVYRKFKLRADQAVNEYGDAVSDKIKEAVQNNKPHELFEFIHAIAPRKDGNPNARFARNLPFSSTHVELKTKKVVRESGFHEFPCAVPRYTLIPGTQYPVGPVFDALPDAATVNKIKEFEYANMDMAVGGLWIAEDDGVLNPRSIKIGARRVIIANKVDSMKPLQPSTNFQVAFTSEEKIQAQIRKILLADVLPPMDGQPRTATEINQRIAWLRQMIGPVYGRLETEYLQVMVERCFGLALRAGALGRPPQSMNGKVWHVQYKSPLARAQQTAEVAAIDEYAAGVIQTAQVDPETLDMIDFDAAHRFRAEALGVPHDIIPDKKAVMVKRAQRRAEAEEATQEQIADELQLEAGKQAVQAGGGQ
jgi:hypothetical protein